MLEQTIEVAPVQAILSGNSQLTIMDNDRSNDYSNIDRNKDRDELRLSNAVDTNTIDSQSQRQELYQDPQFIAILNDVKDFSNMPVEKSDYSFQMNDELKTKSIRNNFFLVR